VLLAGDNASQTHLTLAANTIRGLLWGGEARLGTVILTRDNSILEPAPVAALAHSSVLAKGRRAWEGDVAYAVEDESKVPGGDVGGMVGCGKDARGVHAVEESLVYNGEQHDQAVDAMEKERKRERESGGEEDSSEAVGERPGSLFDVTGYPQVNIRVQFADGKQVDCDGVKIVE
jgi:hypothetical protein